MVRSGLSFSGNESHVIFQNEKGKGFKDVSSISGLDLKDDGRAVCFSDWDQDGDLDVWISNRNGPQIRYLENNNNTNNYLSLKLIGKKCTSDAIGTRVVIETEDGLSQTRTINAGSGFLSQSTKSLHFGLGKFKSVTKITLYWPGSEPQEIGKLSSGHYSIEQGFDPKTIEVIGSDKELSPVLKKYDDRTLLAQILPVTSIFNLLKENLTKPVLISITRNECEQCHYQIKEWKESPPQSVELKILNINDLTVNNPDQLELFQITYDHFYDVMARSIPTPISFLVDIDGNLRSIYRGRIKNETLSNDIQLIESNQYKKRNLSLPFDGIWASESNPNARPLNFVEDLLDAGKITIAEKYIESEKSILVEDDVFPMLLQRIEAIKKERQP
ncbi:MAG: CRTAC1 family protein [Verrucomicrobiales bacterium]|nr:CRTAC1 family protein [Verrucomicrobiales bacterium]